MATINNAPRDGNRTTGLVAADSSTGDAFAVQGDAATGSILVSSSPASLPSALVSFITTVTTAGTRVQLASNSLTVGVILQAPSTNTGKVYIGGSTVSSSVFGAELQPGQSTSVAVNNTNLIYIDSASNGDKVSAIGS